MAFMTVPTATERADERPPVLSFNAKAGRLFLIDRVQQADGEWTTVKTDVTMLTPAFAVDFSRIEVGWVHFADNRAPQWAMAPYGQPVPEQPDSPGTMANGKPVRFKAGFRVPVIGQAIGGLRELAGNSGALINGMNELHTEYEASAEARAGQIPLVKMTNVIEVKNGQGSSFQPVFTVIRYVDRPADLGPVTVAPPGGQAAVPRRATPPAAPAAPAMRAAAARMPPPPVRHAAPVDRWDDEPPARVLAGASVAGWADEAIPF